MTVDYTPMPPCPRCGRGTRFTDSLQAVRCPDWVCRGKDDFGETWVDLSPGEIYELAIRVAPSVEPSYVELDKAEDRALWSTPRGDPIWREFHHEWWTNFSDMFQKPRVSLRFKETMKKWMDILPLEGDDEAVREALSEMPSPCDGFVLVCTGQLPYRVAFAMPTFVCHKDELNEVRMMHLARGGQLKRMVITSMADLEAQMCVWTAFRGKTKNHPMVRLLRALNCDDDGLLPWSLTQAIAGQDV